MAIQSKLSVFAAAILAAACAHRAPPSAHLLKLTVDRQQGSTRAWLDTTVNGRPLKLLVDTGGARSLLPAGFVYQYKIPFRTGVADPIMIDVNGNQLSMPRAYDVPVLFAGAPTPEKIDFLVNGSDDSTTEGLLIPQDLVTSGWALIIDLGHDQLRYEPEEQALKSIAGLQELDYKTCELDNHRVAKVTINGVDSSLIIDSGASRSALSRNNEALASMMSTKGKVSVTAGLVSSGMGLAVENVPVQFAVYWAPTC
ncbi:MAG TPA: hypothetical protein VH083_27395 [Myxococcales bacterium]|nr:hypothetical protein [Myxococcales bacterium]